MQMFGGFLSSNLTHLFPLHETLLLLQVDVVYGEALLCTRLKHDGAVRSANYPALPPRHLHIPQAEREALSSGLGPAWPFREPLLNSFFSF